ncbi:hypothetical protein KGY79_10165 [Candidatus Bipolaricaulota bacterium]|nr:hypothetical protein [Candidatus Bipolaricaulota bacterium]
MRRFRQQIFLALILSILITCYLPVYASQTSYLKPSEDFGDFSNSSNAYLNDGSYATIKGGQDHRYWGFDFEVPAGSSIEGIEVNLSAKTFNPSVGEANLGVELSWDGGHNWTSTDTQVDITSSSERSYKVGGSSDDWGRTWSVSELTNSGFRVKLDDRTKLQPKKVVELDQVAIKIFYSSGITIVTPGDISLEVDRGKVTETNSLSLSYFGNSSGGGQITVSASIGFGNVVPGTVLKVKGGDLGNYSTLVSGPSSQGPLVLKNVVSVSGSINDIKLQLDAKGVSPGASNLGESWEYVLTYTLSSS